MFSQRVIPDVIFHSEWNIPDVIFICNFHSGCNIQSEGCINSGCVLHPDWVIPDLIRIRNGSCMACGVVIPDVNYIRYDPFRM